MRLKIRTAIDSADFAAILGMHLEGPFISPLRLGAHPPLNLEPSGDAFERAVAMRALRLITLAPELPGALDAIRRLVLRATWSFPSAIPTRPLTRRMPASTPARGCSHICYNAMRPLNHRDPGSSPPHLRVARNPRDHFRRVHVHPEC